MAHPEKSLFHIKGHPIIVQAHYAYKALKGSNLDGNRWVLCGFAYDLHDVIPFTLITDNESRKKRNHDG